MAELRKPKRNEMCPPGYHIVRGHKRRKKSGKTTWVDVHIRKNPTGVRQGLSKANIYYLYWNSNFKYESLSPIFGFKNGAEFDHAIQFWLDYWKRQGIKYPADLDPLMIKALIAVESSFNIKARSSKSTAGGLMQVTDQTIRILNGLPDRNKWVEVRSNLLQVKNPDKFDPIVNIALGIRWLGHKLITSPKRYPKNAQTVIEGYHSFDQAGKVYAQKVLALYKKSQKNN